MTKINPEIIVATAAHDDIIIRIAKVFEGTKIMEVWKHTTFRSVEEAKEHIEKEVKIRHGITTIEWNIHKKT